jgi:cytochrome P450
VPRHCAGDSARPKRYFPFAEGPRNCIGQSLAKVSLVATMATLLQHFSFHLADEVLCLSSCSYGHTYVHKSPLQKSRGLHAPYKQGQSRHLAVLASC